MIAKFILRGVVMNSINSYFLGGISRITNSVTRSISAENFNGEKGKGGMAKTGTGEKFSRELGIDWKVSPCIKLKPLDSFNIAEITGPGVINHIWMTVHPSFWRSIIIRIYWDGEDYPSVEVPIGDFFCNGWCERTNISSLPIVAAPAGGFNSYWEMPFKTSAKIEITNLCSKETDFFYQIDYSLCQVDENAGYFHSQWRRSNPVKYKDVHILTDNIEGCGHYVGTYIAWQPNSNGWWGEGEMKFYMDGDEDFPTICGTGTEDYFGGAWNFEQPEGQYCTYSTPFLGMQYIKPDGMYKNQPRFGMYRWHIMDPIRFVQNLKVTIQCLGWRDNARYYPGQDDIASTVFWYQNEPHNHSYKLPGKDNLEVI